MLFAVKGSQTILEGQPAVGRPFDFCTEKYVMERSGVNTRIAQGLWWVGLLAMVAGVGLLAARISLIGGLALGVGMVVLGLNTLLAGDLITGPGGRPFSVRGPVVRGNLEARSGLSDLSVGMCSPDRIASLVYGPTGKPGFEVSEGVAKVRLIQPAFPPGLADWRADLASNVLWDVKATSWLGSLNFDLSQLRLEKLTATTALGHIAVTCPTRGYVQLLLKAGMGDIVVNIPTQTGVKVTIKRGKLASLTVNNPRLTAYRPDRFGTQDYDAAAAQVEIVIESQAGDIVLA
jgi:hypothetical protein